MTGAIVFQQWPRVPVAKSGLSGSGRNTTGESGGVVNPIERRDPRRMVGGDK